MLGALAKPIELAQIERRLARAIRQQGWYEFRGLTEAKAGKLNREFRIIDRWEPTSQDCSSCGFHVRG